ncbi:Protein CBG06478 [Caenorhabditis briggsae]|uniref:Protein CBG06478 n=1 Tax=Caenorhabditis briggsae TaxID=6238 RepID=A8X2B4_CAEBR|nr:Protein CBG06478 [Caenorhabditis briggsae]CAP26774.1 Protein CBG06478 [Caenorhabditis briggsae]
MPYIEQSHHREQSRLRSARNLVNEGTNLNMEYNSEMTTIGMTNFSSTNCDISIILNEILEKMELNNLKNFYITNSNNYFLPVISIRDHSSNFCITLEEMTNFLTGVFLEFGTFREQYCKISTSTNETFGEKVCEVRNFTLSNFDESCKRLVGNIIIKDGDEQYVNKLENVTWIFGTVKIYSTDLTSIDFFDSLEYVTNGPDDLLGNETGIKVVSNRNLTNAVFPNLKKVRYGFVFRENHKKFVVDPSVCLGIPNGLNITEYRKTTIDGRNCEDFLNYASARDNASESRRFEFQGIDWPYSSDYFSSIVPLWNAITSQVTRFLLPSEFESLISSSITRY